MLRKFRLPAAQQGAIKSNQRDDITISTGLCSIASPSKRTGTGHKTDAFKLKINCFSGTVECMLEMWDKKTDRDE